MTEETKTPENMQDETNQKLDQSPSEQESGEKDYKSMYENVSTALTQERNNMKKYKDIDIDKYHELLKEKEQAAEKEKIKKGKYEDVISGLKSQLEEQAPYKDFYDKSLAKQEGVFEGLMSEVPEDKHSFVEKVLKNVGDVFEKVDILKELIPSFKKSDFNTAPQSNGQSATVNDKYSQAKQNGDILGMISNAPRIN